MVKELLFMVLIGKTSNVKKRCHFPLARLFPSTRPSLARIMHETPSRGRGDGRATGQPQGLGPEAYFFSTLQGARPEDARKDGHIRGRSRWFVHNAG